MAMTLTRLGTLVLMILHPDRGLSANGVSRGRSRILCAAALTAFAGALSSQPSAAQSGPGVVFAQPGDSVFRALYPTMNATTGLTPVAEPAVAAGRRAPRRPPEECDVGFKIAEPVTKQWSLAGTGYLLASFFVTTDNKPGTHSPCYKPEPWVCVLEPRASGVVPVDCTTVEPVVFPEFSSLDTAPFRLNETEKAFGVRLRSEISTRSDTEAREALILFRLHDRRLTQVLAVTIGLSTDTYGDGECSRELTLGAEKTTSGGFFDWRTRTGKKTGKLPCRLETGTYRWDGARYVKSVDNRPRR